MCRHQACALLFLNHLYEHAILANSPNDLPKRRREEEIALGERYSESGLSAV